LDYNWNYIMDKFKFFVGTALVCFLLLSCNSNDEVIDSGTDLNVQEQLTFEDIDKVLAFEKQLLSDAIQQAGTIHDLKDIILSKTEVLEEVHTNLRSVWIKTRSMPTDEQQKLDDFLNCYSDAVQSALGEIPGEKAVEDIDFALIITAVTDIYFDKIADLNLSPSSKDNLKHRLHYTSGSLIIWMNHTEDLLDLALSEEDPQTRGFFRRLWHAVFNHSTCFISALVTIGLSLGGVTSPIASIVGVHTITCWILIS